MPQGQTNCQATGKYHVSLSRGRYGSPPAVRTYAARWLGFAWHLRSAPRLMSAGEGCNASCMGARLHVQDLVGSVEGLAKMHITATRTWTIRRFSPVTSSAFEGLASHASDSGPGEINTEYIETNDFIATQYLRPTYNPSQAFHPENATMTSCLPALLRPSSIPLSRDH